MTIAFECTSCKSRLQAKPKLAGKTLACPKCNTQLVVPQLETPAVIEEIDTAKKPPLATDKQKVFATELGITFPDDIDRRTISKLIDDAIEKQVDGRYDRLNDLQDKENKIRSEIRDEIMAECDEDDPRMSVATTEQMLEALAERDTGAILITFEYGVLSGGDDLTGEKFKMNSTDDIDENDLKTIVSWLGMAMLRR